MRPSLIVLGFVATGVFILFGFYTMYNYDPNEGVNTYVGGDAYNLLINANHAIGYFIVALISTVFSCTLMIIDYFDTKSQELKIEKTKDRELTTTTEDV